MQVLDSRIEAVTVFRSGADVRRVATIEGIDGPKAQLRLDGLPLCIDDRSLRCRLRQAQGLVASDIRVVLDAPSEDEELPPAEPEELRQVRTRVRTLEARLAVLVEVRSFRMVIPERAKPEEGAEPLVTPLEARLELLEFSQSRDEELSRQISELEKELETEQNKLDELEEQNRRSGGARQAKPGELRKTLIIRVEGRLSGTEATLEVDYHVPGASWAPAYALRLGPDLRDGELSMRAVVCQRSGEDWEDVKLRLSTADRQAWSDLPELKSRRIGRKQGPMPRRGFRPPPTGAEELYGDYDRFRESAPSGAPVTLPAAMGALRSEPAPVPVPAAEASYDYDDYADDEITAVEEHEMDALTMVAGPVGAAPPPAPSAMPMPASFSMQSAYAPEPESRAKERSKSKKRAAPARRSRATAKYDEGAAFGGAMPGEAPMAPAQVPAPESLEVATDTLDYSRLRMPDMHSRERGALRPSSTSQLYAEYLEDIGKSFDPRITGLVADGIASAHDLAELPTGHQLPWSEDYDYAFDSSSRVELPSDGQYHSLPVCQAESSSRPKHVVVPRESSDVFRTVEVDNPFDAPLLAGPIDVYWDGDFLLTSHGQFTAPRGELTLGLGVDQAIKVARNTQYREDTVGLMGGGLSLAHKIHIEVANHGAHSVNLEVRERIPVPDSSEEDIKVEVKSSSPTWSAYEQHADSSDDDKLDGGYKWNLDVDAGQSVELSAAYDIKISSKFELRGGNRREW